MAPNGHVWSPIVPFGLPCSCMVFHSPSNGPQWILMVQYSPVIDPFLPHCTEGFRWNHVALYNLFDQQWSSMNLPGPLLGP